MSMRTCPCERVHTTVFNPSKIEAGIQLRASLGEIIMNQSVAISRRGFVGAMLGGAVSSAQRPPQPLQPLVPWMYMIYPIEQWLSDYRTTLDA